MVGVVGLRSKWLKLESVVATIMRTSSLSDEAHAFLLLVLGNKGKDRSLCSIVRL